MKEILIEAKYYNIISLVDHFSENFNHFSFKCGEIELSNENKTARKFKSSEEFSNIFVGFEIF
jgi:hypothetical protein